VSPQLRSLWPLLILIVTAAFPAAQPPSDPRLVDVFVAGDGGYHTYRIPSVIATPKGTLLAFAEGRRAGAGDAGDIDLVLKRSVDGGVTWSALEVIGDNGPNTFGNPCPVIDRTTGVIWLLSTHNLGTDREKDIIAGTSGGSRTVWVMKSEDDGVTWTTPVEITASVKRADWTWYATGPGTGIQTQSGRLVIPANHAEAGSGVHRSHVFFSDDRGRSWRLGASLDAGTNESQVVELTDGRLLLNMRNHPPKPENHRMVATSRDGGETWTAASPDRALVEPPAQASLIQDISRRRLVFANPASGKRERMTVRVSDDSGVTWPIARVVHEGPAAYSSLVALPDSAVGLLFERGEKSPYERMTFARLPSAWLDKDDDRPAPSAGTVEMLPSVPDAHGFAGAFAGVHDGHLIAAGGANFPAGVMPWNGGRKVWHQRVLALDLERRDARWRDVGRLPTPNGYGVSLSIPEGVLIVGGGNADRHFTDVSIVTLTSGRASFRRLPSLPQSMAQMAGAVVGRHVHVAGGIARPDATVAMTDHYRLDLDGLEKGWQAMPPLPGPGRMLAVAAAIDDAFYVVGGCSLAADAGGKPVRTYLRDGWKFTRGGWQRLADLPRAATAAASPAPISGSRILVISGDDGGQLTLASPSDHRGFTSEVLRYDTTRDVWERAGAIDATPAVTLPTAPWRDGFILFNGERRPGVRTPQVVLFRPAR
jgi:N-acetylneuraminic acid mutarotase